MKTEPSGFADRPNVGRVRSSGGRHLSRAFARAKLPSAEKENQGGGAHLLGTLAVPVGEAEAEVSHTG